MTSFRNTKAEGLLDIDQVVNYLSFSDRYKELMHMERGCCDCLLWVGCGWS